MLKRVSAGWTVQNVKGVSRAFRPSAECSLCRKRACSKKDTNADKARISSQHEPKRSVAATSLVAASAAGSREVVARTTAIVPRHPRHRCTALSPDPPSTTPFRRPILVIVLNLSTIAVSPSRSISVSPSESLPDRDVAAAACQWTGAAAEPASCSTLLRASRQGHVLPAAGSLPPCGRVTSSLRVGWLGVECIARPWGSEEPSQSRHPCACYLYNVGIYNSGGSWDSLSGCRGPQSESGVSALLGWVRRTGAA